MKFFHTDCANILQMIDQKQTILFFEINLIGFCTRQ